MLGQLTETIDPLERKTKREYDAAGNLKKTEDALGRTITYSYDNADRLKEIDYSEAGTADVTYKYDKNSNVVEMVDGTGTTTKEYDQLGRLTEVKNGKKKSSNTNTTSATSKPKSSIRTAKPSNAPSTKPGAWKRSPIGSAKKPPSPTTGLAGQSHDLSPETTNVDEYAYSRAGEMTEVSMKKEAEVLASMTYTRDKIGQVEKAVETGFPKNPNANTNTTPPTG